MRYISLVNRIYSNFELAHWVAVRSIHWNLRGVKYEFALGQRRRLMQITETRRSLSRVFSKALNSEGVFNTGSKRHSTVVSIIQDKMIYYVASEI